MSTARPKLDYLIIVAFVMGIGALGTDMMLPGLGQITETFEISKADGHLMVTVFFFGMALGQVVMGPLSDTLGRKGVIIGGYAVFCAATLVSAITSDWTVMLLARAVQGIAAAAPRIVIVAMVRDEYAGRSMAQVMSVVGAVFITVPIFAPMIGQGFLYLGDWRAIFIGLCLMAAATALWFALRLPETLSAEARTPFRVATLWAGLREVLASRIAVGYTLAQGFVFGLLIAYLGTAQQTFEAVYGVTDLFAIFFGLSAASVAVSSLLNGVMVMRFGMRRLSTIAGAGLTITSASFAALLLLEPSQPLWLFVVWNLTWSFFVGILFINLNALAMEPMGHIAGLAAAFIGALSTFMSLPLAAMVAEQFDGTLRPLAIGFTFLAASAWALIVWTEHGGGLPRARTL